VMVVALAAAVLLSGAWASTVIVSGAAWQTPSDSSSADDGGKGWTIPAGASHEPNPIEASPQVVEKGKNLFQSKCEHCHGKEGKGNGPDADRDTPPGDLSDGSRASRNPDGVMFYKVWNGRKSPKMPAFKTELSKDDVWTVVDYAKTLRK
jgi:mono/diheme cytochrome c family protein